MSKPLLIKEIKQKDNYTFSILWSDGNNQEFRLNELQMLCPCANCTDEETGKRRVQTHMIKQNVMAHSVRSVGRYALQIKFTSGCSTGIYSFDYLREIKERA